MKKSINISENLQINLISTLIFYKNIFHYKNVLIIVSENNQLMVIAQTGKQIFKPLSYTPSDIPISDKKNVKDKIINNSHFTKIYDHFKVHALFSCLSSDIQHIFLGINSPNKKLNKQETKICGFFAHYLENIINNEHLVQDLEYYSSRLQQLLVEISSLHKITRAFGSGDNIDSLLKHIMKKCMRIMNTEAASMMMVVESGKELEFKIILGPKSQKIKPFRLPMGKGIAGWVAQKGKPVLIEDVYSDSRFDRSFDQRSGFKTRSMLCVPMFYKEKIMGVMTVLNRRDKRVFNGNDQMILTIFSSQAALAIKNAGLLQTVLEKERLDKELQVAASIQSLLIPTKLPEIKKIDVSATYLPCGEVSGDFYDVISIDKNKTIFVIADVSGKGIPGAMVVSNLQATLRAYLEYSTGILKIVKKLNENLIRQTTSDRFITFFIGLLDSKKLTFRYVNAGHNPPFHFHSTGKGKITKLKIGGLFIGLMPFEYNSRTICLKPGDVIVFYTDGLVESMNENNEEFGEKRLSDIILKKSNEKSQEIKKVIIEKVKQHIGTNKLEDDFTLVITKVQ